VRELGLVDRVADTAAAAVEGADLVVICVPVCASGTVAQEIGPHLAQGAIVTDVGSVKGGVIRDVEPYLPQGVAFVAGHPIAGTEHSGPDAGFAELFEGRWCVLTPSAKSTDNAVARLTAFWKALGSAVETMPPEHHDLVLAITSHVPHLIAYNIVATAADLEQVTRGEVIKFSAGGFRDFTRIAASDPIMWRDVFLTNKKAVLEVLGRFSEDLAALQRAIRWDEGDRLVDLFTRARGIRRGIIAAGQDTAAPDFGRPHGAQDDKQKR
jgi:cyclohexadieny/prephenate dehydrogenase